MKRLHPSVQTHLIEIFKAVADVVDGGQRCPADIRNAYNDALANEHVKEFYGSLIDQRHKEVYGKDA